MPNFNPLNSIRKEDMGVTNSRNKKTHFYRALGGRGDNRFEKLKLLKKYTSIHNYNILAQLRKGVICMGRFFFDAEKVETFISPLLIDLED